jgi:hypothetical protein
MNRIGLGVLTGVLVANANACTRDDGAVLAEVKKTNERLAAVEQKLDTLGRAAGARPQPNQPARPQPGVLYHVPVNDNDAYRGGAHAKVTIVEAFEFA